MRSKLRFTTSSSLERNGYMKLKLKCIKVSGEQWAPQIEISMARMALEKAISERRLGLVEVSRRSATGAEYVSVFEVSED